MSSIGDYSKKKDVPKIIVKFCRFFYYDPQKKISFNVFVIVQEFERYGSELTGRQAAARNKEGMGVLQYCIRCQKLISSRLYPVCGDCLEQEKGELKKIEEYLLDHPTATTDMLQDKLGIEKRWIIHYIRERRVDLIKFPQLTYPCKECGIGIQRGEYCPRCVKNWSRQFSM